MMILVQALVTALMAGVVSGVILFGLNERRDRQRLLLDKTEHAIEAYSIWVETLQKWIAQHLSIFVGDKAEARARLDELWHELGPQFARARMLIGIYLPERLDALDGVSAAYFEFMTSRKDIMSASFTAETMPASVGELIRDTHGAVADANRGAMAILIATAGTYVRGPFLVRGPTIRMPRLRRKNRS